jgi:hypothetical protein
MYTSFGRLYTGQPTLIADVRADVRAGMAGASTSSRRFIGRLSPRRVRREQCELERDQAAQQGAAKGSIGALSVELEQLAAAL